MQPLDIMKMVRKAVEILTSGKPYTRVELFSDSSERNLQRRVLDRLVSEEILSKEEIGSASSVVVKYQMMNAEELGFFLQKDGLLVSLIWPHNPPPEVVAKLPIPHAVLSPTTASRLKEAIPPPPPPPMPPIPAFARVATTPVAAAPTLPVKVVAGNEPFTGPGGKMFVWVQDETGMKAVPYIPPPPPEKPESELSDRELMERMILLFHAAMESIIYMRDAIDEIRETMNALRKDLGG